MALHIEYIPDVQFGFVCMMGFVFFVVGFEDAGQVKTFHLQRSIDTQRYIGCIVAFVLRDGVGDEIGSSAVKDQLGIKEFQRQAFDGNIIVPIGEMPVYIAIVYSAGL
jgi:hypothetical protein